jgi:hypothetical protein
MPHLSLSLPDSAPVQLRVMATAAGLAGMILFHLECPTCDTSADRNRFIAKRQIRFVVELGVIAGSVLKRTLSGIEEC